MANMLKVSTEEPTPLESAPNQPLDQVKLVLGWRNKGKVKARGLGALRQALARTPGVDLDAAALLCNARGEVISACSVDDDDPFGGTIVHGGDDKGRGREAQEEITMSLSRLPNHVQAVVFTLTSFTGKGFNEVNQTSFKMYTGEDLRVETYVPISNPNANAALMVVTRRKPSNPDEWEILELSELVYVDPHFGGNQDGAVNWQDLGSQYSGRFRINR